MVVSRNLEPAREVAPAGAAGAAAASAHAELDTAELDAPDSWAQVEFGGAHLGDARRTARLVQLATVLAQAPGASLPAASGELATLKAAYRFFDSKAIRPAALLESHAAATLERARAVPLVLAVQDTTYLDWTHHPHTSGLGPLVSAKHQGLLAHSTLLITPERLPLGLLAQEVWARDAATFGQQPDHKTRPIEDKESHKWLTSVDAVNDAARQCPQTQFVSVADREADIYDLWRAPRARGVHLLVRAAWNRGVMMAPPSDPEADPEPARLFAAVAAAPLAATLTLHLPPQAARPGHAAQPARQATVSVRWTAVTLRPPRARRHEKLPEVAAWAVWVVEEQPPAGLTAVEWLLLTTTPVLETSQALQRVEWYACRWGIEVWHKVLKSGCRIEARQLETAARLERCLALYSVIAWRILYSTMLARAVPEAPCTVLLEEAEWQALHCRLQQTTEVPAQPPSLREAVRGIARLGGFLGRRGDGEPGVTVLWRGFQQLREITTMYRIMRAPAPPPSGGPPGLRLTPGARDVGND